MRTGQPLRPETRRCGEGWVSELDWDTHWRMRCWTVGLRGRARIARGDHLPLKQYCNASGMTTDRMKILVLL